ncbi:MAG: PAS domain-containing protein [Deltaproteobacteria bacterium]|nr:PAS domain-containing protein [Deltaproteobacteria bacterium]
MEGIPLRTILDGLDEPVLMIGSDHRVRMMNRAARIFTGAGREGDYCHSVLHGSKDCCVGVDGPCPIKSVREEGGPVRMEHRHLREDGRERICELIASPLHDEVGRFLGILESFRDITERKEMETDLERAASEWRETFDAIPDFVSIQDPSCRIVRVNKALADFLGERPEEIVGRYCYEIYHGLSEPFEGCPHKEMLERGETVTAELENSHMGLPLLVTSSPIRGSGGEMSASVYVAKDLTLRKRMEAETLKCRNLESLGHLAGGIAHDINNLLTPIIGNLSFVRTLLPAGAEVNDLLKYAEGAAYQIKDLADRFLTFSAGGAPVKEEVSLPMFLTEACSSVLEDGPVRGRYRFSEGLAPVFVDPHQVGQAIRNLIQNACEAMPKGGDVYVEGENVFLKENDVSPLPGGDYVRVTVRDEGPGISRKDLPMIFDPYFSTKPKGSRKGMGLGLVISYSIIAKHGGTITVESELGKGSCFTIYIPAFREEPFPKLTASAPGSFAHVREGRRRILVMDDDEGVRSVTGMLLRYEHFEAEFAADGREAMQIYREALEEGRPFDAVILDLTVLGGMGGEETIRELRALDPSVRGIVSSGYSDSPVLSDYRAYGFMGVLRKPYGRVLLRDTLRRVLGENQKPDTLDYGKQ